MNITKLYPDRWEDFKKIRLESFETDPQAFDPNHITNAAKYPEEKWKEWMTNNNAKVLVAKNNKKIVGLIGSYNETDEVAVIWGTYVTPSFRGKGIGKMLLQEIIKAGETDKNIKKIKLLVDENQKAAISLYKQFGFSFVGKDIVHLIMEKPLE